MRETDSIETLKGIGPKTKEFFQKAGIETVEDLLRYYPKRYEKMENPAPVMMVREGDTAVICASLAGPLSIRRGRNFHITAGTLADETGKIQVIWHHMPYMASTLKRGQSYIFRGKITKKGQAFLLVQPAVFDKEKYKELQKELQPVYPLVQGLTENMVKKAVKQALKLSDGSLEFLPGDIQKKYHLSELGYALEQIHFPKEEYDLHLARRRLVFEEFLLFILSVRQLKQKKEKVKTVYQLQKSENIKKFSENLGYDLTRAQKKVWQEIEADMRKDTAMARLVQGDVGSGKTVIAVMALLMAAENGYQGALMVPTEVLAKQHYESICSLFRKNGYSYQAVLLTGSTKAKEKKEIYRQIESGEAAIIVGTHALIQEKVCYKHLALAVTDEQHRFGVKQREELMEKGKSPHILVMSATPIPRTLAVILYGDLDISVIDELPAERLPIKNCVVDTTYRPKAYRFIQKEIEKGHQAYIICPMVEESENLEAENVIDYTEQLREELPEDISIAYLHGKMKAKEKNEIMERFVLGKIQILVSTTVVEVGVNVPNATVMMIENAERFGLAQLHQLRGRVGRGKDQSYCIMIRASDGRVVKERLEILNQSNDGFYIAGQDLKLRGPGDLFGIKQSGIMEFKIGDVFQDAKILQEANEAADQILIQDPDFLLKDHQKLKNKIKEYFFEGTSQLNL
ncbi:MAG: ATP-dependent DNA helicase RecG [Eubacteriales bacterium]|nr:ATP-dependent DNA helicase RecG [Eubacteriales bacterium]